MLFSLIFSINMNMIVMNGRTLTFSLPAGGLFVFQAVESVLYHAETVLAHGIGLGAFGIYMVFNIFGAIEVQRLVCVGDSVTVKMGGVEHPDFVVGTEKGVLPPLPLQVETESAVVVVGEKHSQNSGTDVDLQRQL